MSNTASAPDMARLHDEMVAWRHHLHQAPELSFRETSTAAFIAARLREFGLQVRTGLGGTGVVGTLRRGAGERAIALRADMDAVCAEESGERPYRSRNPGAAHACGHDGHMSMLLGAARLLSSRRDFDGIVHFIFQPSEENDGGARRMIADGLFREFPVEAVYGLHNWPDLPAGRIAVRPGPVMAGSDRFEITVTGRGCHAAMPHQGVDPILAAAQIVTALQSIVSRSMDPLESAVVSVTQVHAGDIWNVIPDTAVLRGTVRTFAPAVRDLVEARIQAIAASIARAAGANAEAVYTRGYPPTVNSPDEAAIAAAAARRVVGDGNVETEYAPSMAAEDFSDMLEQVPGCYAWLGAHRDDAHRPLHNPSYDFNDAVLCTGAAYWVAIVEQTFNRKPA